MANQGPSQSILALRAATYRISSTPTKQLPHVVQQVASSLWTCKDVLSTPQQTTKSNSESAALVHRFRTSVSSLLQDRTIEGRWAGVVLAKATIEAGGLEILSKAGPWIKSLLAILKKRDPPTTRILTVITLTRIFVLTWDQPNLVRELTTPNLPAFVTSCLSNAENSQRCSGSELQTILEAFAALLPRHPTIFRSHEDSIKDLVGQILSQDSDVISNVHYTSEHKSIAQRLRVQLHHCAPKQGAAEKWREAIQDNLSTAHSICDTLFGSAIENWNSDHAPRQSRGLSAPLTEPIANGKQEYLGSYPSERVFARAERLIALLAALKRHLETATAGTVAVPIGQVVDLVTRLFSIVMPAAENAASIKANPQVPKEERDLMYTVLPEIHVASLQLVVFMIDRFGASIVCVVQPLLERATEVFIGEKAHINIRTTTYEMLQKALDLIGSSMSKEDVAELVPIMKSCCDDLMPREQNVAPNTSTNGNASAPKHQVQTLASAASTSNMSYSLQTQNRRLAARALLVALINNVDSASMPRKIRVQIERIAIFTQDKEALVACVMNPAKNTSGTAAQTSLLPVLAKLYPDSSEVEALLRPRMPLISPRNSRSELSENLSDEESVVDGASEVASGDLLEHMDTSYQRTTVSDLPQQDAVMEKAGANDEDLYTASPRLLPRDNPTAQEVMSDQIASTGIDSAVKRPAIEPAGDPLSSKRLRAAPVVDPVVPESAAPAAPDMPVHSAEIVPVEQGQAQAESFHQTRANVQSSSDVVNDLEAVSHRAVSSFIDIAMDSESGSDVEVPPLTMESDSEPDEDDR